jgi:hypothetical protein
MELTTQLNIMPRSGLCEASSPCPIQNFMAWCLAKKDILLLGLKPSGTYYLLTINFKTGGLNECQNDQHNRWSLST